MMKSSLSKKRVLVFGAAGFMGTYLIDALLNSNYHVVASDIDASNEDYFLERNIPFINIDITKSG